MVVVDVVDLFGPSVVVVVVLLVDVVEVDDVEVVLVDVVVVVGSSFVTPKIPGLHMCV